MIERPFPSPLAGEGAERSEADEGELAYRYALVQVVAMAGGDDIPDFLDRDAVGAWLRTKPRDWSVVIAARAALRAFPAVVGGVRADEIHAITLLSTLRGNAAALFAGICPSGAKGEAFYRIALGASAADSATSRVSLQNISSGITGTSHMADAAASAAAYAISGAGAHAVNHISVSTLAAAAIAIAAVAADAYASVADAVALMSNKSPDEVARCPLWEKGKIEILALERAWRELKSAMLSDGAHWQVWVDWYEDVLAGRWRGEAYTAAFTDIPGELPWDEGPEAVNAEIAKRLASLKALEELEQSPRGYVYAQEGEILAPQPAYSRDDVSAANLPHVRQLHAAARERAKELASEAARVRNLPGWEGLSAAADQLVDILSNDTAEIPLRLGDLYGAVLRIGSYLELDKKLRADPGESASPLDAINEQKLSGLVAIVAPWARQFPTIRTLDEEFHQFTYMINLTRPALEVLKAAEKVQIIKAEHGSELAVLIQPPEQQSDIAKKGRIRGIFSIKNIVFAATAFVSFEVGLVANDAAPDSIIGKKGAEIYLQAEKHILELLSQEPTDLQLAIIELLRRLKDKQNSGDTPTLPKAAIEARRKDEDGEED